MRLWPFGSGDKKTSDVTPELADNVKEFFDKNNPDKSHGSIFEATPHHKRVNEVLLRQQKQNGGKGEYDYTFERYKQAETIDKATYINCAELQEKVADCLRNLTMMSTDQCKKEIGRTTKCAEIQKDALKKLFYEDCYNTKQCDYIRFVTDKLFTENFGQYGENVNDETKAKFDKEIDKAFYRAWK
jgi:hypothetical protein